ncbi:MAG: IPT/TIG domain-containing protein [Candidatus Acidiferrum sp.]
MTILTSTAFRSLLLALSILLAVAAMLQGCSSGGNSGGGTPPPDPSVPSIGSLSQASGPVGTAITIAGTNFGAAQGTSTVTFNGTAGTPTSWSGTSIAVAVPSGATTGNVVVTVGGVASNGVNFTVTAAAPNISSLSQVSGPVRTAITIAGTNFGAAQGTSTVTFNGTAGTPTSWSGTSIAVAVPSGATTGNVVVTVGGVASNGVNFTVTAAAPNISSLSQVSGPVGTAITIAGTNFGAAQGTSAVTFNGTAGTPTSWSGTSIAVVVPSGATTGNVVVTVGGVASNGVNFTVTAAVPVITSSDTASGTVGTAFSYQITATNSPTSFGALGLPAGFTVDTVSGLISGTPTGAALTFSVTLSATNGGGTGTTPLTLTISGGGSGTLVSHTIQISNDADDGYYDSENGTGWISTPTAALGGADRVGSWASLTTAYVTGYRFPSVGANSGDTIQSAYLQLVSSDGFATSAVCGSAPCSSNNYTFRVYGVAQDDGPSFTGATGNTPLDVPYTTSYTDYTTTGPGDDHGSCQGNNNGQNTCTHIIDVTNIVREITSRPGWTNTSAMRFVLLSTDSTAPNVYVGFEDSSANASKAATLVVNPPVPTIVSSGVWGTNASPTYPTTYTVGPFVYPGASTLLLFLGDYYIFYGQPIPQPTVSDSCGNNWNVLVGPTNWAGISYDMRSTVYYVQNPATCPAGATITVTTSVQEPIFLHFFGVVGSDTINAPTVSAITSPSPGTYTTSASSNPITLTQAGLLMSWIFGDSDVPHVFTPQAGFITDLNSTPTFLTGVFESVSSPGSYQSQFSISPSADGWQVVIIGLQAP